MATRRTMFMTVAYASAIITIVMRIAIYIRGGRDRVIYPE